MNKSTILVLAVFAGCSVPPEEPEQSVKPGINKSFLDPDMKVDKYVARFEGESREIFAQRTKIARAVGLVPGSAVADVGAGTGLFTVMFAKDVGPEGAVYAVDIAPKFIDHLRARAEKGSMPQIQPVLCTDRDVSLPAGSVDAVFICDTYHHFEYPKLTMETIHRALRPGGQLFLVDFERIPGVTREWVMKHVRAGKDVVREEIESSGFELEEELEIEGLRENYVVRFRRP